MASFFHSSPPHPSLFLSSLFKLISSILFSFFLPCFFIFLSPPWPHLKLFNFLLSVFLSLVSYNFFCFHALFSYIFRRLPSKPSIIYLLFYYLFCFSFFLCFCFRFRHVSEPSLSNSLFFLISFHLSLNFFSVLFFLTFLPFFFIFIHFPFFLSAFLFSIIHSFHLFPFHFLHLPCGPSPVAASSRLLINLPGAPGSRVGGKWRHTWTPVGTHLLAHKFGPHLLLLCGAFWVLPPRPYFCCFIFPKVVFSVFLPLVFLSLTVLFCFFSTFLFFICYSFSSLSSFSSFLLHLFFTFFLIPLIHLFSILL